MKIKNQPEPKDFDFSRETDFRKEKFDEIAARFPELLA